MLTFSASTERINVKSPRIRVTRRLANCATCAATIAISLAAFGCSDEETYDVIKTQNPVEATELDDTAPPEPTYDEALSYMGRFGVEENHSDERFRFDVAAYVDDAERVGAERLYPHHAGWLSAHGASSRYNTSAIPSVQTIGTYVKQLDDTIYAGVEMAVQDGLEPTLEPKRTILTGALDYLASNRSAAGDEALVHVAAALRLGGGNAAVPSELEGDVESYTEVFLANTAESKPIGFYTWSQGLQRIWQQDRLLQQKVGTSAACSLAAAIAADPDRKQAYLQLLDLYTRLTNPLRTSLREMLDIAGDPSCTARLPEAFLGASRTPEVALFEELYPLGVPADADLMDDLVTGIREGRVDLTPSPEDGWYQHQLFALETLLVTDKSEERAKVAFMLRYKKRLREAFETMLVQHRETHVKQADRATGSSGPPMPETPHFRVEPLATVYVRHARSYVFLESALDAVMGEGFLDAAFAVGEQGAESTTLRARIHEARDRFFGLYVLSCQDIGLMPRLNQPGDPDLTEGWKLAEEADAWLLQLSNDDYAKNDVRVMVPIADLGENRWKYWAVIGVRSTLAGYSYIHGSDVSPPDPVDQARVWLPTEQFIEVVSSATPMTRDEFRSLCDTQETAEAIQAALESR